MNCRTDDWNSTSLLFGRWSVPEKPGAVYSDPQALRRHREPAPHAQSLRIERIDCPSPHPWVHGMDGASRNCLIFAASDLAVQAGLNHRFRKS